MRFINTEIETVTARTERAGVGNRYLYIYIYINSRGLQFILVGSPFSLDWSLCGDLHPLLSTVHLLGILSYDQGPEEATTAM